MRRYYWLFLFLTACEVGPKYKGAPKAEVGAHWVSPTTDILALTDPDPTWWKQLGDPLLAHYMEKAEAHNFELKIAEANILEAKATRRILAAPLFPWLGADLLGSKFNLGKNGLLSALSGINTLVGFFFDASWEVDLFGKTRRNIEGAAARVQSAEAYKEDLLLSILAEVASNYIQARSAQTQEKLTKETITFLQKKKDLTLARQKVGLDSALPIENVDYALYIAESQLADLEQTLYHRIYSLSLLLGEMPDTLVQEMLLFHALPKVPDTIAIGLKSDLLRRRPDVRQQERLLAAATADVGVAVASLFPSFSLFGGFGFDATALHQLFKSQSQLWYGAGNFAEPLFQGGKLWGTVAQKKAALQGMLATYQQTVLTALQEAESTLTSFVESKVAEEKVALAATRQERLFTLVHAQATAGLVSELKEIDQALSWLQVQTSLAQRQTNTLLNLTALYKALGGSWH